MVSARGMEYSVNSLDPLHTTDPLKKWRICSSPRSRRSRIKKYKSLLQWVNPALIRGFMMEFVGDRKIAYALEEMVEIAQCVDQEIQKTFGCF